ncbi:hypothetical protein BJY01DRAFT_257824 [Aspergillus pseudoustus]|uniref:SMP-30/Gluconolactonase/LRE-like region domain-containing protein n=1 Tax=Aspergillus pseudoustus TaxID=1810923 RepID=A0ABR4JGD4_9EURO
MRAAVLFTLLSTGTGVFGELYTARKAYQLDPGTWIENLSQRGGLSWYTRLTRLDSPIVQQVDPSHQHGGPNTIYTFPDENNATGIAELAADKYAVLTVKDINGGTTVSIWTLDASSTPTAHKVIDDVLGSPHLNGLAAISPTIAFATDSLVGGIVRINLETAVADKPLSGDAFGYGINGLKYRAPYLYYTNTIEGVFGRVAVDPVTGAPTGEAEVIASGEILVGVDDFTLAYWTEAAFVANFYKNTVVRIDIEQGTAEVVVEDIPAPTSAAFGTSGGLYIATSGTGSDGGASIWAVRVPDETFV